MSEEKNQEAARPAPKFVHLHVHSDYSILDGAATTKKILNTCAAHGMHACALTDHGNVFGVFEFQSVAKDLGLKSIIGCEVYVAPASRIEKQAIDGEQSNYHLLLLCENETGYHNLCKLSSAGYIEGFYYKPRVDKDLLRAHHEGLIAASACLGGEVPHAVLHDDLPRARKAIEEYIDIFGKDNFLIELMDHDMPEEEKVNPTLVELAREYGLMLIATNDCHYANKADVDAHEALLCIQTNTNLDDPGRFKFPNDQFYIRTPEEMESRFSRWPEAVSNTLLIAERCNCKIPTGLNLIPAYQPPDGKDKEAYLRELVYDGLEQRFGKDIPETHRARADYELSVIVQMKFVDYFLVVWDLIHFARKQGIPVGPGRGSGAGSLVAYCLFITNLDPMRYQLLFERFLNPDRVSMPDFDLDFCYIRRAEMIEYAHNKYGRENVSQIVTFGRMLARNAIRNVGRVFNMPLGEVDRIAKLVPEENKITLKLALEKEPDLRAMVEGDANVRKLWDLAVKLEGTIGNCGTHAAGVVICDHPLTDHVALYKASNSDTVATQVEMNWVDKVGLLKMDLLGLRTLTVIHDAVKLIKKHRDIALDIDNVDLFDEKTYSLLRSGDTTGVFQLESAGMRDVARRIGLQSIEEICALVALYRPGPMQFIDAYIEGKYDQTKIVYDHPLTEAILRETYGIAIYQEQVMQLVQACAGFSLGQADIVRRAMGKKKVEEMEKLESKFVAGCGEKGIDAKLAKVIWDKIAVFAGYGFNKSHSMAYAFVAYQTAYLKANYPAEFLCALLTSESGNLDKTALYVEECRRLGMDVLPPDVNHSDAAFSVEHGNIRFGLGAIKGLGEGPTSAIETELEANGPFADIFDFCTRIDSRSVNKRTIESLNKAGAFESTGWNRRQVDAAIEIAMREAQLSQRERDAGQFSLFEMSGMEETANTLHSKPDLPEWPDQERLQYEKDVLGLYVSGHPLRQYASLIAHFATIRAGELNEHPEGTEAVLGGLISGLKTFMGKKGKMAFLTVDTLEGACEITVFSELYEKKGPMLLPDTPLMFKAKVNYRNSEASLIADDIYAIGDIEDHLTTAIHVHLDAAAAEDGRAEQLAVLLGDHRGECDVFLHCAKHPAGEAIVHATAACRVAPSGALRRGVEALLGPGAYWCSGPMHLPTHRPKIIATKDEPAWKRRKAAAAAGN